MDWLPDFTKRFWEYHEIRHIKQNKFHGTLEIHFADGVPHNANIRIFRKAGKETYQPFKKE